MDLEASTSIYKLDGELLREDQSSCLLLLAIMAMGGWGTGGKTRFRCSGRKGSFQLLPNLVLCGKGGAHMSVCALGSSMMSIVH